MMKTVQVSVEEITEDLQRGTLASEIMSNQVLSENGLRRLLERLLKAGCVVGRVIGGIR